MSTDHRAKAEELLAVAAKEHVRPGGDPTRALTAAQVYATLTRNEEHAATTADLRDVITLLRRREYATREAVSQHVAKALASREKDRWRAGLDLTKALDEADCNIDNLVDARLSDDGWDPRSAYKAPASAVPADPWAAKPDITAEIPEPVRRVLVDYLAAALLSKGDAQGVGQTITFALKHAGANLASDIEKRISELTLGADPSEPPF
ncbi:hypothetical protein [Streptomyces sp. CBMA152]|uniref:hypothetical protein n=1 Tax=Streptomyces sp. CBMA152 TaxID=1896312 RepID=UPI001660656E|nr:hypothetical protein [Streptomyces sp. CBMA152]MBD0743505.1 hypothetical protein [Streptomyces sp. CBMA152]